MDSPRKGAGLELITSIVNTLSCKRLKNFCFPKWSVNQENKRKQTKIMADAIVSVAIVRLAAILEEKVKDESNLVRGVKKELRYLSSELTTIRTVLEDAEMRGYKDKSIQLWLKKLEDLSYDVDDMLDEWNYTILKRKIEGSDSEQKVCSCLPGSSLSFKKYVGRRDIALKIRELKERLEMIVKEKDRYGFVIGQTVQPERSERVRSTSSVDVSEIQGREIEKDALVKKLMLDLGQEGGPTVISIVGTGGIGKTTLGQLVYNDREVRTSFELKIWICVSDVFDEVRIAKGIVEAVTKNSPNLNELEALLKCLEDSISGKKFLLVLDDVWTEDYTKWEPFRNSLKCGDRGSKILVTTRSERVARMMGTAEIHHLGQLSQMDCWLLMRQMAFFGRREEDCEELKAIGENIAKKCNGLPLAAKVLGSLLRFKDSAAEWEDVLRSEIWQLEKVEQDLFPHLFLSYNELSPTMKRCFLYCVVFPKDSKIDVEKLIEMWMALGYLNSNGGTGDLELRGKEYFDSLRMRSFFQDFDPSGSRAVCKMHDIVHDFAQFVRKTTNHIEEDADPSLISQAKVYRTLFHQLDEVPPYPLDSATCLRVLTTVTVRRDWFFGCRGVADEVLQCIEKLIHLRYFDLNSHKIKEQFFKSICKLYSLQTLYLHSCNFNAIPREIENLANLRHLNLSGTDIKELPETICNLYELRILDIGWCRSLSRLPEGIHKLTNLRHLQNEGTLNLREIPQGLEQLTGLQTLMEFRARVCHSKLGYLKKMDRLSGSLKLIMILEDAEDPVEAKKAELRNKKHLRDLHMDFTSHITRSNDDELLSNEVLEALPPPPYLQSLHVSHYRGTKFPGWITTSLNHLRDMKLEEFNMCSSLPPLGKLPCLEQLSISNMIGMEFLDREFLGIVAAGEIQNVLIGGFPKLQKLSFQKCTRWKKWEDITGEQAANDNLKIMPCLKELSIEHCFELSALPYRLLLHKAPAVLDLIWHPRHLQSMKNEYS